MPASKNPLGRAAPLVLARFASAIISTVIPLVLARAMDLAEYGSYKQIFLVTQTLYLVLPFGMVQSLYFFVPRTELRRPLYTAVFAFLALGMLLSLGLVMGAGGLAAHWFSNPDFVRFRWPIALYIIGMLGSVPLEIAFTAEGRTRTAALIYLVSDTAKAAVMVLPVVLGMGLGAILTALAAFSLLRTVITISWLWRTSHGPLWDRTLLRQQLAYAAPFGGSVLLAKPTQSAHQYAVSAMVEPSLFALYAVGCFQLPLVDLLYTPTTEVLMVQLGELDKANRLHEAAEAFRSAAARLAYVFTPMAAVLFVSAPEFIGALFGPKYLAATPIFRVSVCGVLMSILPIDGALRSRNHTRHIFWAAVAKAVAMVPLAYFGVRSFGMLGGILSWVLGETFGKVVLGWKLPEALAAPGQRVGFSDCIPWRALGRAAAASAVGIGGALAAKAGMAAMGLEPAGGFLHRVIPLALEGGAFCLAYVAVLPRFGVDLRGLIPRRKPAPAAELAEPRAA